MFSQRLLALFALPILFSGTAAVADDAKTFPGTMCQTSSNAVQFLRTANGRMENISDRTQTWLCPIVRDTMVGGSGESAEIFVIGNVNCTLESRTNTGGAFRSQNRDSTVDEFQVDNVTIRRFRYAFGDVNFGGATNGIYLFNCLVPRTAAIASYKVTEDE